MFDVSFSELMLIGVIALIVIGPERLPKVARTIGHLVGRAQRYVSDVKSDIQREMDLDELNNLKGQMEEAAKSVKSSMQEASDSLRQPLSEAEQALKEASASVESLVDSARAEVNGPETTTAPAIEPAKPAATPTPIPAGDAAAAPSAGADIEPSGTARADNKEKPGTPT
ncbi:twin-arginine translocase subunit TatB [Alcaligenaceae bacterium]|nr:twin-arginine translocase subunit TatB [Alcaligenaceae bacterium]